jgi:two-component system, response regulator PdtaR
MRSLNSVCVLVVEDESLVRMETVDFLVEEGFSVLQAHNADAAILILEKHAEIRLIFTDIHMPGSMDGLKLAHYVRRRWPPVRIILTSGKRDLVEEEMPVDSLFMTKPYRHSTLKQKICEMAP